MDPAEVLAVEIRQYVGDEMKTLVPRVIGLPAKPTTPEGRQWDETSFFTVLRSAHGDVAAEAARFILDWAKAQKLRIWWGKGKQNGSFMPVLDHGGVGHTFIAVWSNGYVELQFQHMRFRPPFDNDANRRTFLDLVNKVQGAAIAEDALDRRPGFKLRLLETKEARDRLKEAMEWFLDQVRRA